MLVFGFGKKKAVVPVEEIKRKITWEIVIDVVDSAVIHEGVLKLDLGIALYRHPIESDERQLIITTSIYVESMHDLKITLREDKIEVQQPEVFKDAEGNWWLRINSVLDLAGYGCSPTLTTVYVITNKQILECLNAVDTDILNT